MDAAAAAAAATPNHDLPLLAVGSVTEIDSYAAMPTDRYQLFVAEETTLADAVAIQARMRAGNPGVGFKVFNPELVTRKVEAEAAMRAALEKIQQSIDNKHLKLAATRQKIACIQAKIDQGRWFVRVGPSINSRAQPFEQIIYPSNVQIPVLDVNLTERKLSRGAKLRSREADGYSQICFWEVNLVALKAKEKALVSYLQALTESRDDLAQAALHNRTRLGSGYSDYSFEY